MWRWVTRGLVLAVFASIVTPAVFAQDFIGVLDLPSSEVVQSGVVLVKGYALDPHTISKIELYVDDQFQQIVPRNLPRIDVIEAYPNYPGIHTLAPGFQVGFLANRFPNGPHSVAVRVYTSDNKMFEVGRRTITIDNTINQSPFGALDIPDALGVHSANGSFPVAGWAADTDGIARIDVQIDEGNVQTALYGDERPDVFLTFPDFPSSQFSGFIANVDTTRIQDGVHTLTVRATDRLGLSKQIGLRTVQILNSENNLKPFGSLDEPRRDTVLYGSRCDTIPIISPPVNPQAHITPVRGWALDLGTRNDTGRVSYVELMIDGVRWFSTDDCAYNPTFQAYTNCYGLPRYDVEKFYPNYPDSPRAGFMFTMDIGALLALGVRPGNHVLKVRVGDQSQTFAELPGPAGIPVFFQCAESTHDFASQGFIDIPTSFDFIRGDAVFQGWTLDENGGIKSIDMIVDGTTVGQASYGYPRTDVAVAFPNIFNALNSGWRFTMDTRQLGNGRHRLTVRTLDNQNFHSEIGSVDFYTQN